MKEYKIHPENRQPGKIDLIIECLLGLLLVVLPLSLGGVKAWSKELAVVIAGAITICFTLKLIVYPQTKLIRSWAYVPVVIFILLAVFQTINLPAGFVGIISPSTASLRNNLLNDSEYAGSLSSMTLSLYPNATNHDLRLILSVFAVFVVVVNTFRTLPQIKRLLTIIIATGGFVALIAMAQNIFGNDKISWLNLTKPGASYSGTFVNHNHYGQFMNLSIGAAIALLLIKISEVFGKRKITAPSIFGYLGSSKSRFFWVLTAIISIGAATIFLSLTRGGMAAIIVAMIFTAMVMVSRKSHKGHGWIMVIIALVAFACVLYTSFDAVCNRLSTLRNFTTYENRWQVLKDLTVCFGQFPVFGTGLGTHAVVYPMYDSSTIEAIATHAENEYAQVLEETGVIGLILLGAFGVIIWKKYIENISRTNLIISGAAYGLGFGLAAILFQSLTDFGQHIPANTFLSAIFCALIIAINQREDKQGHPATKRQLNWPIAMRTATLCAISGLFIYAIAGADNARRADAAWKDVQKAEKVLAEKGWQANDAEYQELISRASKAVSYQSDNINYRYWLNVYRWRSISRQTDEDGRVIFPEGADRKAYAIAGELDMARFLCPTFGPPYCILGQIQKFVLDNPKGSQNIKRGLQLAPCDAVVCFVAGFNDIMDGNIAESVGKLKKAVAINGGLFKEVAALYIRQAERPDLAIAIAGDDMDRLKIIASLIGSSSEYKQLLNEIREKLTYLLEKECENPDAPPSLLVSLAKTYSSKKDGELKAIELYQRALASDFGQVDWRLNLAKLLAKTGQRFSRIWERRNR